MFQIIGLIVVHTIKDDWENAISDIVSLSNKSLFYSISMLNNVTGELKDGLFSEGQRIMIKSKLRCSHDIVIHLLRLAMFNEQCKNYWVNCLQCMSSWCTIIGEEIIKNDEMRKKIIILIKDQTCFESSIDFIVSVFSYQKDLSQDFKLCVLNEIEQAIYNDIENMLNNPSEQYSKILLKISELFTSICETMFSTMLIKNDTTVNALTIILKILSYPSYSISYSTFEFWTSFKEFLKEVSL